MRGVDKEFNWFAKKRERVTVSKNESLWNVSGSLYFFFLSSTCKIIKPLNSQFPTTHKSQLLIDSGRIGKGIPVIRFHIAAQ